MSHYFTNDYVKSDEKIIKVKFQEQDYTFITDNGVFSKKGLDFGTRSLLEKLDYENIRGDVLDFGCGYGPIGIIIKKKTKANVDLIDINKRSLALAIKNANMNQVDVNVFESDIYNKIKKKYDFIITNPPIRVGKKVLYQILFDAKQYLKTKGKLIVVINKNQGAKSIYADLTKQYKTKILDKNKGFYIIEAIND